MMKNFIGKKESHELSLVMEEVYNIETYMKYELLSSETRPNQRSKQIDIESVERKLKEAKSLKKQLELISHRGDGAVLEFQNKIKMWSNHLDKIKADIMFSIDDDNLFIASSSNKEEEHQAVRKYIGDTNKLSQARRDLSDGILTCQSSQSELCRMSETLKKSTSTTDDITGDLSISSSLISHLTNLKEKNKRLYISIASFILVLLMYTVLNPFVRFLMK